MRVLRCSTCVAMQVRTLTQEVAQLKAAAAKAGADGLAEKLQDLAQKTEDRQARAETAIYQVRVRCCVMTWRLLRHLHILHEGGATNVCWGMFLLQLPCTSSCAVVSCVGQLVRHVLVVHAAARRWLARWMCWMRACGMSRRAASRH
jgi:hypothetical protein